MTHHHLGTGRDDRVDRALLHARSGGDGHSGDRYVVDQTLLSDAVRFDRARLGDIAGLRAVHLQCHLGTDTLSLARLGARVVGVDFSPGSLARARELVARTGDRVEFIESDLHCAVEALGAGGFDLVYIGVGALCWLPRIDRWAAVVAALLAPGGRLFLREAHPLLWAMDETLADAPHLRFPYFEHEEPLVWDHAETPVDIDRPVPVARTYEWNHGLGEIVTALLVEGLQLTALVEHDSVPWNALPGQLADRGHGEHAFVRTPAVAPLSYTVQAVKPSAPPKHPSGVQPKR